ncbi:MAG: hypothetical protein IAE96_01985 [Chitinophagaceae bacterium]|nr:hypothetical protein [Chitinophagaceae bacterium]
MNSSSALLWDENLVDLVVRDGLKILLFSPNREKQRPKQVQKTPQPVDHQYFRKKLAKLSALLLLIH